jgi:PAS domain S-box-containing protein
MANTTIPIDAVPVESVLCTDELRHRSSRAPDLEKENAALVKLMHALSESPREILQILSETILEVTNAGSAGLSLLTTEDGGQNFYWPAVAGIWKDQVGGGTPRNFGPCGEVLDRNSTLLFSRPERRYTYLVPIAPPIEEVLLVPFYVEGEAKGTIWAVSHDVNRKFDAEDERIMISLSKFTSSAFQIVHALESDRKFKEQARIFNITLSTISDFAYIFDRKGRFIYANQALLDLWGLKAEEAFGKNFYELQYPKELAAKLHREIEQVFVTRRKVIGETEYTNLAGFAAYYEYIFTPVFDGNGNVEKVAGSTRNISERKKTEEMLRDAKRRLEATLYTSEIATWVWDVENDVMFADENMARLFSVSKEVAAGAPLRTYLHAIHPEDLPEVKAAVEEALATPGKFYERDYRLVQSDGSIRWVIARGRVEHDASGRPLKFPGVLMDITQIKQIQENFRQLSESLEATVQSRTQELLSRNQEMLQQAEQLRVLSSRLLLIQDNERRHIARELHDSVGQTIVALAMSVESISQGDDATVHVESLQRSRDLVQDLSKEIRTMSYLLHPPLLDETGLSGALHWYIQGMAERSGLQISLQVSETLGRFRDEIELAMFRIIQECLTNIHRHSGAKTASVELVNEGGDLSLKIQDDGKGIPAEKLEAIRLQSSGVGMTGMRERVRHLGGGMHIDSNERGTMIAVRLPV